HRAVARAVQADLVVLVRQENGTIDAEHAIAAVAAGDRVPNEQLGIAAIDMEADTAIVRRGRTVALHIDVPARRDRVEAVTAVPRDEAVLERYREGARAGSVRLDPHGRRAGDPRPKDRDVVQGTAGRRHVHAAAGRIGA